MLKCEFVTSLQLSVSVSLVKWVTVGTYELSLGHITQMVGLYTAG